MLGTYTVTTKALTPSGAPSTISHDFTVEFLDPCTLATFTFAPGFLEVDPIEYQINSPALSTTFLDSMIISSETIVECGEIELTLTNLDGTLIDPAVWSWDSNTQTLKTETDDASYYKTDESPYPFLI